MKDSDQQYFRDALNQQRNAILDRASHRFEPGSEVNADGVPDFADYANDKAQAEVSDQIAGSEDNLLEKINLALERLEAGQALRHAVANHASTSTNARSIPR